ncbi:MAG: two-component system, NtrC family, response regulator [Ignavibacteria bacterium]|nr:two-component system, NtrC family, response regulator [Ignavibacteria bacterium]
MKKYKILLVDDEESQREAIKGFLEVEGYTVFPAFSHSEAIKLFQVHDLDLVLTDFRLLDKTGLDVLKDVKSINPLVPVIVMTAFGTIDSAVNLMKQGAFDYLQKPIELDELLLSIQKCEELSYLKSENKQLKELLSEKFSFESIISQSGEMESILSMATRVANSKATVLVRGESGTGKELIARAIHFASDRKDKPFIVVNCAAMPETLFESELFGHEKGAFTGAERQRLGKFELASQGTLFIDEVGDIPAAIQVKLLRAIQFGQFERLGGNKVINTDVRIITATNRNLEEMIRKNEFREDLYYRFNVVPIFIPPLRARKVDIPVLTNYFIKKYAAQNEKEVKSISKEAMNALMKYDFPGNIRELENMLQRSVVLTRNNFISINDLPNHITEPAYFENKDLDLENLEIGDMSRKVEELEKALIELALKKTGGVQVKAAELLNISDRMFRYKFKKYKGG